MQTFSKFLGIILLSISIFSGCRENISDSSPVSSYQSSLLKGSGPSSTGQGKIVGTDRVFAFNATTRPNGTVQGQGTLNRTDTGTKFKFDINCLSVNGNVAIMSGTVTESNAYPNSIGLPCWFKVKDNGEGTNAPPDEITFWYFCDGSVACDVPTCGSDLGVGLYPIEAGNIQVKP
jgi:hypothetical protein